ncbi:MAG: DUF2442 domain-containing protein [Clostridia bacterium]|nr:DUF2442 domain-containing protein [Clostridia bacterium]
MYIKDGYVYGGQPSGPIKIVKVKPLDDFMMILTFSTGEQRLFDATLLQGPVFQPLKDIEVFKNAQLDHGVVTWLDGDIDCSPEYMYANSFEYASVS